MRIAPNIRLNGKLYFKSLDMDWPVIETDAQMDGAKNITFKLITSVEGRLSLLKASSFRVDEETYRADDLYSCRVTSGLTQKLVINDFYFTIVSGTFHINEETIGVVESFAIQGTFAPGHVDITTDPRPF